MKGLIEKGKKISIKTVDDTKYIMKVIEPLFELITKNKIQTVEKNYPETVKHLFEVAFCIVDGSFGKKLMEIYASDAPSPLPFNTILILMLLNISKSVANQDLMVSLPEIFNPLKSDPNFQKTLANLSSFNLDLIESWTPDPKLINQLNLNPSDVQAFLKIFHNFIDHFEHPSHLLIDLLIHKMHLMDRAVDTALMIRNPIDRSKAFELLINEFLIQQDIDKAKKLWELIPSKQEKYKASIKIVEKLIENGKIEEAIQFSDETKEQENHDQLLREASLTIAKGHLLNKAIEVMETIKDPDIKNYTQSNLVHILCSQFDFANAKKVALSIPQADFKEDAIVEIVKNYLQGRQYDEATTFMNSLSSPNEKQKPAKLIETALKIQHLAA